MGKLLAHGPECKRCGFDSRSTHNIPHVHHTYNRYMCTDICGYKDIWIRRYINAWMNGCIDAGITGSIDGCINEFMDTRIHGDMVAWRNGEMDT